MTVAEIADMFDVSSKAEGSASVALSNHNKAAQVTVDGSHIKITTNEEDISTRQDFERLIDAITVAKCIASGFPNITEDELRAARNQASALVGEYGDY